MNITEKKHGTSMYWKEVVEEMIVIQLLVAI